MPSGVPHGTLDGDVLAASEHELGGLGRESGHSFFFQAEDGIRDIGVTGVQTCALPICDRLVRHREVSGRARDGAEVAAQHDLVDVAHVVAGLVVAGVEPLVSLASPRPSLLLALLPAVTVLGAGARDVRLDERRLVIADELDGLRADTGLREFARQDGSHGSGPGWTGL